MEHPLVDLTAITELLRVTPSLARAARWRASRASPSASATLPKPATIAAIAGDAKTPVLLLTAKPSRAEALAEELPAWLGDAVPVLLFRERDPLPYERIRPRSDAVRDRLPVLSPLASGTPASSSPPPSRVSQRTLSPQQWRSTARSPCAPGDSIDMEALLKRLVLHAGTRSSRLSRRRARQPAAAASSTLPAHVRLSRPGRVPRPRDRDAPPLRPRDPALRQPVSEIALAARSGARSSAIRIPLADADLYRSRAGVPRALRRGTCVLGNGDVPARQSTSTSRSSRRQPPRSRPGDSLVVIDEESDIAGGYRRGRRTGRSRAARNWRTAARSRAASHYRSNPGLALREKLRGRLATSSHLSRWASDEDADTLRPPFGPRQPTPVSCGSSSRTRPQRKAPHGHRLAAGRPPRRDLLRRGCGRRGLHVVAC